jgi:hypothetical protein
VVVAEDPASAGQGVLIQLTGRLVLAQLLQGVAEAGRRGEGVWMIVAEHAAGTGQGVLVELACLGVGSHIPYPVAPSRGKGRQPT